MSYVIKIGGVAAERAEVVGELCRELVAAQPRSLVVHGGGKLVSTLSRRLGIEPTFRDGVRLTSPEEMSIVEMGLCGAVNGDLVRAARARGVNAWGIRGSDAGFVLGRTIESGNRTAVVERVNTAPIEVLWSGGYLPVSASVAAAADGGAVNINADEYAQAVAQALGAFRLVFISDIPGVLNESGERIPTIELDRIEPLIASGVASGGMAAKLRACADAVRAGVKGVIIGDFGSAGDLIGLLEGKRGTTIHG